MPLNGYSIGVAIPAKGTSTRLPNKNLLPINGKPLVRIAAEKLLKAGCFDEVFIDTDSDEIWRVCMDLPVHLINRPPKLASNATDGNGLMQWEYEAGLKDFDIMVQYHCTSPLIKPESIADTVEGFCNNPSVPGIFNSFMTVCRHQEYLWEEGERGWIPLYNTIDIPNSFDLPTVVRETHALYGIMREQFERYPQRTGKPYVFETSELEAYDINTKEDYEIVRTLGETLCRSYL